MKNFTGSSWLSVVLLTMTLGLAVEFSVGQIAGRDNDSLESDWTTLMKIYRMTGGAGWTNNMNWDITSQQIPDSEALGRWYGVTVSEGRVTQIELGNNNLRGMIPWALGNLSRLEKLDLSNNQIQGSILPEIGKLSHLRELNLASNEFSGVIPSEIGNLHQLSYLNLRSNQLNGQLPPSIGNLRNLSSIYLNDNQFSGQIPEEWERLSNLRSLWVAYNESLKGPLPLITVDQDQINFSLGIDKTNLCVPPESNFPKSSYGAEHACLLEPEWNALVSLYQATDGRSWDLNANWDIETRASIGVTGKWVGVKIYDGRIRELHLPYNNLEGTLPPELSALTELKTLNLNFNPVTGPIPPTLIALQTLQELSLDGTDTCLPSNSALQNWVSTVETVSNIAPCALSDGENRTASYSQWKESDFWIIILLIILIGFVLLYGIFQYSKYRKERNVEMLDTQSVNKSLDSLKLEATNTAELVRNSIHSKKELSDYSDSLLSMQRTLSERELENERLKRGYDNVIFRKFITPFIRLDQTIAYLLNQTPSSPSLESIHRLLKDALMDSNVESFTPEVGSDYRKAIGVTDHPKIKETEIQEDDYKIAEVLEDGYLIRGYDKNEVLIPSHVVVYRFKKT